MQFIMCHNKAGVTTTVTYNVHYSTLLRIIFRWSHIYHTW